MFIGSRGGGIIGEVETLDESEIEWLIINKGSD